MPLADRINMVFMGTAAVSGKARAIDVATALHTELGKIAAMMQTAPVKQSGWRPRCSAGWNSSATRCCGWRWRWSRSCLSWGFSGRAAHGHVCDRR